MATSVDSDMDINLTPMLDMVLQLIMFFMITVNFVRVESFSDQIQLPVAASAAILDKSAENFVFLNLDANGKLVGSLSHADLGTPEKLRVFLKHEKEMIERDWRVNKGKGEPRIVIVLRADAECRYKDVWQVVDSCQKAGYRRWQLRVKTGAGAKAAAS